MVQILCTLPNASDEISGVKFTKTDKGMLSADITDEQAAGFLSINGYKVLGDEDGDGDVDGDDLGALRARAKELGVEVKANWKAARLTAEIKRAEEAKAAADAAAAAAGAGKTE